MGSHSRQSLTAVAVLALSSLGAPVFAAVKVDIDSIRNEIGSIERELLTSQESQLSAASQLKKIKRLLALQQKEIQLSQDKVRELTQSMETLSTQKQTLLANIDKQKIALRKKLRDLDRLAQGEALDASWLGSLDAENQKAYFLGKTLRKDLASVENLKKDVQAALALELKILEEKNRVDYYVQELHSQSALLSANQMVQQEIIRTNRSNRLEAMRRMRELKESEHELEKMIARLPEKIVPTTSSTIASAVMKMDLTLAALKGKLPLPVDGQVLTTFGKSFNPKTNLLTFQKGITLGADPAAGVKTVSGGKVVFAGPLKNYGLIVIVEHPGQYYTLYGQLGSVAVEVGRAVAQGDLVGKTAGEPLYFEIRNKNVAINPLQWLANGSITLSKQ